MSRHIILFALWLLPLWACAGNDASGPRYLVERGASANVLQVRLTMQGEPPFTLLPARQLPGSAAPASPHTGLPCKQPAGCPQPALLLQRDRLADHAHTGSDSGC